MHSMESLHLGTATACLAAAAAAATVAAAIAPGAGSALDTVSLDRASNSARSKNTSSSQGTWLDLLFFRTKP